MNFKNRAIKFQEEKEKMEDLINRGINKFNRINKKRVENIDENIDYISEYDTPVVYSCGEKGITIIWFEDIGRCGSTEYEKNSQLIPYEYFEENEDLDKLNEDIIKRENQKNKIIEEQRIEIEINSKRLKLEKDIRELAKISSKYEIRTGYQMKKLEKELKETKIKLEKQKNKIKEIKNEL